MQSLATKPRRPMTVAVADDDADMRDMVGAAIRDDGYRVVEMVDGLALLDYLDRALSGIVGLVDIAVVDVRMPNLSGFGVLDALRRAHVTMPVVVMTGMRDASVRTLAMRLGAVSILQKPFHADELRSAVHGAQRILDGTVEPTG